MPDSKSGGATRVGSTPTTGTKLEQAYGLFQFFLEISLDWRSIIKAAEILRVVCVVRRENGEGKRKCGTEEDFGRKELLYRPVFYSKIFVHSSV